MSTPIRQLPRLFFAITTLLAASVAWPADMRDVSVELEDGRYQLKSETWLDVSPRALYRVLTDYDLFIKFTSSYVESRNMTPTTDGKPRFYTRMEACVLFFCKSFTRSGYLLLEPEVKITAIGYPESSDFDFSHENWHLIGEDGGTLLIYSFEMDPSFWVPPVVGPFYMKRALRRGGKDATNRIEALAQEYETEE